MGDSVVGYHNCARYANLDLTRAVSTVHVLHVAEEKEMGCKVFVEIWVLIKRCARAKGNR